MTPTGTFDQGDLVLVRTFTAPIDDVWASITESDRLGRWYGTWTGDPADGYVMLSMTAEPGAEDLPAFRHDIEVCEPPRALAVRSVDDHGTWQLSAHLDEVDGVTTLEFRQREIDLGAVGEVGPGWEWYLDRLVAEVTATEPPDLDAFETRYLAMGGAYRELAGSTGSRPVA